MKKKLKMLLVMGAAIITFHSGNVYAYDGDKAAEYASNYCGNGNPSYPSYGSDCTNFASQCVKAGGISGTALPASKVGFWDYGDTYMCKNYWSCQKYNYKVGSVTIRSGFVPTSTWTIVDQASSADSYGFQDYMENKKSKYVTTYACSSRTKMDNLITNAKVGDIVQIKYSGGNRYSHTYIVGKKKKNSSYDNKYDLYFYAHTSSRDASKDDSLRYLLQKGTIPDSATLALISM